MRRLTWWRLAGWAAVGAGVGAALGSWQRRSGATPPTVPWTALAVLVSAGGVALTLGWMVRQYRRGKRPGLDPLQAARTAMFAQACAFAGAALAGAFGAYGGIVALDWGHEPRRSVVLGAAIAALVSLGLCAAGWVAERWCAAGGDDDDPRGAAPDARAREAGAT